MLAKLDGARLQHQGVGKGGRSAVMCGRSVPGCEWVCGMNNVNAPLSCLNHRVSIIDQDPATWRKEVRKRRD